MTDSILGETKSALGLDPADDTYDIELIASINSAIGVAYQVGGVPQMSVPQITGLSETWSILLSPGNETVFIKQYIFAKVKVLFDPPKTSFATNALTKVVEEYEWRLREYEDLFLPAGDLTTSDYDKLYNMISAESQARMAEDDEIKAMINSISIDDGGLPIVAEWQVNPQPGVIPGGHQVSADDAVWANASSLSFVKIDELGADMSSVLADTVAIHGQQKINAANWIRFQVTGPIVDNGSYVTVPVECIDGGGSLEPASWQLARFVLIINN